MNKGVHWQGTSATGVYIDVKAIRLVGWQAIVTFGALPCSRDGIGNDMKSRW